MRILLFSLLFIGGLCAQANSVRSGWVYTRSVDSSETHRIANSCKALFAVPFALVSFSHTMGSSGQLESSVSETIHLGRPEVFDAIAGEILTSWRYTHSYTTDDKIVMLMKRDQALDPRRVAYFQFKSETDEMVAIRVFDASDRVYRNNEVWNDVDANTAISPTEKSLSDFLFPARVPGKEFTGIDIGLLNSTPNLIRGTELAFTQVAEFIDQHYNANEFQFFGRGSLLKKRNMKVYAQTRLKQVDFFRQYGLKPVMKKDKDGVETPVELTPGMILIEVNADEFIEKNHGRKLFADHKQAQGQYKNNYKEHQREIQQGLDRLDKSKIKFSTLDEIIMLHDKIMYALSVATRYPLYSEQQSKSLAAIFTTYYKVVNSIPENMRDGKNWTNLRHHILSALIQPDPQLTYYYFFVTINRKINERQSFQHTANDEKEFFRRFPMLPFLPLGIKPEIFK